MHTNSEIIMTAFENSADRLFAWWFQQFKQASNTLDREGDENVFQQLSGQYAHTLKHELVQIALRLIDEFKETIDNISSLQQMLTKRIEGYLNEFNQKTMQL